MNSIFSKLLSDKSRLELQQQQRELLRIFSLTDRFLAEELLRLCRSVRDMHPAMQPHDGVYDNKLFWQVIPEAAKRLGAKKFRSNECTDYLISSLPDPLFRKYAGHVAMQTSEAAYWSSSSARLLLNEPINGNVLGFALDRLHAPTDLSKDPFAKCIKSAADSRNIDFDGLMTRDILNWNCASLA